MPNSSHIKNLTNKRYYCELCDTNNKDKYQLDAHLKTNKHAKNVDITKNKIKVVISSNCKLLQEKYKDNTNIVINPLTNRPVKLNTKTYKKLVRHNIF